MRTKIYVHKTIVGKSEIEFIKGSFAYNAKFTVKRTFNLFIVLVLN